jgi:hypothetical protein
MQRKYTVSKIREAKRTKIFNIYIHKLLDFNADNLNAEEYRLLGYNAV